MKKNKLLGIEICRGLSAYAVLVLHSGDQTWSIPIEPSALAFRSYFQFAVPFFLIAAFYFTTAKTDVGYSIKFWKLKFERIMVPYAIWSILFLISRVVTFTLSHKQDRLQDLLQSPLAIIFLGGASYHLYFLPLLFTGTFLTLLMPFIEKLKYKKYSLFFLLIASIVLECLLKFPQTSLQLSMPVFFQGLVDSWNININQSAVLKLVSVEITWLIRCASYFFAGIILNRLLQHSRLLHTKLAAVVWGGSFLFCNIFGLLFLSKSLQELFLAFTLILFSIAVSNSFRLNSVANFATSLGACSFGIYLIHPFIMNLLKFLLGTIFPRMMSLISIPSIISLSITSFFVSWLVVAYLHKNEIMKKYLFGA
jgi:peptidoglycan/LPS O-acetylase OafA/YrhL